MRVTLEVKSGLMIGRRFDVMEGPGVVFGRSDAASCPVPHDPHLADFHFSVRCVDGTVRLKVLAGGATTVLNGEAVEVAELHDGDRIVAGHTEFLVTDLVGAAAPVVEAPAAAAEPPPPETERTGPELLEWLGQDEDAQALAEPGQTAKELLPVFVSAEKWAVALRLRAHLFEPRLAVWWGCLCLKESFRGALPEEEKAAFAAAAEWVADPTEENRRAAEAAGPAGEGKGIAIWLSGAAFWSEGSLAPAELAPVAPDERLSGQAVAGALLMATVREAPEKAGERSERYLAVAEEIVAGKHPLPVASRA